MRIVLCEVGKAYEGERAVDALPARGSARDTAWS
jgi:hypothetical protein